MLKLLNVNFNLLDGNEKNILSSSAQTSKYCKTRSRSSHQRCSMKKGVLKNFTKFTGNHLCQSLFLNKVAGLRPATLLKKKLWHRCFPVNFLKFLSAPFLQNTSGRLLLKEQLRSTSAADVWAEIKRNLKPHSGVD